MRCITHRTTYFTLLRGKRTNQIEIEAKLAIHIRDGWSNISLQLSKDVFYSRFCQPRMTVVMSNLIATHEDFAQQRTSFQNKR